MRSALIQLAKAQYKWHKHSPLIRFIGPRKGLWSKEATSTTATVDKKSEAINFWELPTRYRPLPISDVEMEAIDSGGASLH